MACSVSQTSRVDPIVDPGTVSGHVHKFAGGSNVDQNSDFNSLLQSPCSSCEIQSDKSAYWTPQLYFAHANGKFEEVPNYGMTVYYVGRGGTPANTIPFPPGFKMISGDTFARSYDQNTLTHLNTRPVADRVSFRCINEANDIPEEHYMFRTDCVNGMRAQINFQSCWDGVNLYKEDNSHVAYLSGIDYGTCPPSHPVSLPGLFFEVLYFTNQVDQSAGGQFVFANGDPTGYGFHADFINAWDMDIQDASVNDCLYTDDGGLISACRHLAPSQDVNFARTCPQRPSVIDEVSRGIIDALPGCNPITSGPGPAPDLGNCPVGSNTPSNSAGSSGSSSAPPVPSTTMSASTSPAAPSTLSLPTSEPTTSASPPDTTSIMTTVTPPYSDVDSSPTTSSDPFISSSFQTSSSEPETTIPSTPIYPPPGGASTISSTQDSIPVTSPPIPEPTGPDSGSQSSLITDMLPTTSAIGPPGEETTTITITSYITVTVTVPYNAPGGFFTVTDSGPSTSIPAPAETGGTAPTPLPDTTITLPGTTFTVTIDNSEAPTTAPTAITTTVAPGTTITETTITISLGQSGMVETTTFIDISGTMYTITGPTTATFFSTRPSIPTDVTVPTTSSSPDESSLSSDEITSTTTMTSTTTITVTVTPTSTRTIPEAALTVDTALLSETTGIVENDALTSSAVSMNADGTPSTAFVTVTTSVSELADDSTPSTATADTTYFTIRGREVFLTYRS
ncbi:hypothetical protein B0A52_03611 [Exophiala mesophila]|uniref:DUF1996 domain-containing protein n=1 Tax=Exophiala mesophila TaxID=212818 RepID=A0A438N9W6_EXOME|nr:hypothetical protein B0A52_03611 [Exophiala mesophila]